MKLLLAAMFASVCLALYGDEPKPLNFQEVFNLARTNLTDVSEEELSRMAALGLIKELGTRVQLVSSNASAPELPDEVISRRSIYNDSYGNIQIRAVDDRLPGEFQKSISQLNNGSNTLKGLIIDLRYAQGGDYEAAARIADLFVKGGELLLKMGEKEIRSTDKSKPIDLPAAVLVNGETRGAAEALAALLKETGSALVIGSTTAGEARLFETFTLATGQQLRVGKIPVEVGDHKAISAKGLAPDIAVTINPAAEKVLYRDPYRLISANSAQIGGTNEVAANAGRSRSFPRNEAELVRRHRAGIPLDEDAGPVIPDGPVINDPALARALDFLKGISVLQQHRPL